MFSALHSHVLHVAFTCVTRCSHMVCMLRSHVLHVAVTWFPRCIHMCYMLHSHMLHVACTRPCKGCHVSFAIHTNLFHMDANDADFKDEVTSFTLGTCCIHMCYTLQSHKVHVAFKCVTRCNHTWYMLHCHMPHVAFPDLAKDTTSPSLYIHICFTCIHIYSTWIQMMLCSRIR